MKITTSSPAKRIARILLEALLDEDEYSWRSKIDTSKFDDARNFNSRSDEQEVDKQNNSILKLE